MNKRKGLNMEQKRNLTGWAFLLPASILIFVFCFYPMVQALILSFQKGTGSAVQPAGFANYLQQSAGLCCCAFGAGGCHGSPAGGTQLCVAAALPDDAGLVL